MSRLPSSLSLGDSTPRLELVLRENRPPRLVARCLRRSHLVRCRRREAYHGEHKALDRGTTKDCYMLAHPYLPCPLQTGKLPEALTLTLPIGRNTWAIQNLRSSGNSQTVFDGAGYGVHSLDQISVLSLADDSCL
uniref:Uncharacterized protein n=1 Tax=Moniliophthora roreri TaxID=221103 RepID=A0A0W0FLT3_MONRR